MVNPPKTTKLEILLLVEDDDEEAVRIINIIREASTNIAIVKQKISAEALDYLRQVEQPPQLILFDLGMRLDGISFIKEMKSIEKLKPVPLIVLTGIAKEIAEAHAAGIASGYIVKPMKVNHFESVLSDLGFTT